MMTILRRCPSVLLPWFRRVVLGLALITLTVAVGAEATEAGSVAPREPQQAQVDGSPAYVLGFDVLSAFPYEVVDVGTGATDEEIAAARQRDQVPAWVHVYDGQRVVLTGYLMPLKVVNGRTTKFVMMKDVTTCCYGATPRMNDYVVASMPAPGAEILQDVPVALVGTFKVEQRYEGGYVVSLYVIEGERLLGPKS